MTTRNVGTLLLCTLLLSACDIDFAVEVFTSDVFLEENVPVPMTMKMEVVSCNSERLATQTNELLGVFSNLSQAEYIGCTKEGTESHVTIRFKGEMASQSSNADVVLFRLPDSGKEGHEHFSVNAVLATDFLARIRTMAKSSMVTIDPKDIVFTFDIQSDMREPVFVNGNGWIDGKPYAWEQKTLERREAVTMEKSNLVSALLWAGEQVPIFWVSRPIPASAE